MLGAVDWLCIYIVIGRACMWLCGLLVVPCYSYKHVCRVGFGWRTGTNNIGTMSCVSYYEVVGVGGLVAHGSVVVIVQPTKATKYSLLWSTREQKEKSLHGHAQPKIIMCTCTECPFNTLCKSAVFCTQEARWLLSFADHTTQQWAPCSPM